MGRAWLYLLTLAACSSFGADGPKGSSLEGGDGGTSNVGLDAGTDADAGLTDADRPPPPICSAGADGVMCEDFEVEPFRAGWDTTPLTYTTRVANADPDQRGVGRVSMSTKFSGSQVEDFFGRKVPVDSNQRRAVGVKLKVRMNTFPASQNVEVLKLDAGKYVIHMNLRRDEAEEIFVETRQFNVEEGKDTNTQDIGSFVGTSWVSLALELRTGAKDTNEYDARLGDAQTTVAIKAPYDKTTATNVLAGAGLTYVDDFFGAFAYDIDDIIVMSGAR